ncbi:MAG: hypothetical protein KME45_30370 [Stenomitos rutilans HA7619-LM2]|nr:hypothetical protein [Stenomitos rutilans HA7619-LM2]
MSKFDANQVRSAFNALSNCGIEPTAPTMQALVETAEAHYPNDPASLEKAARSLAMFFEGSTEARPQQKFSWHWFRALAFSLRRL